MKLTKIQIDQQDFVDNTIFDSLKTLNPTTKELDWDIEMIGSIRDVIQGWIIEKMDCSEQEFYSYITMNICRSI